MGALGLRTYFRPGCKGRYRWILTLAQDRTWRVLREAASGPDEICRISAEEIAARSGVSRRSVTEHLKRLEQLGRIRRLAGGRGRGHVATYRAPRDFRRSSWAKWERRQKREGGPDQSSLYRAESVHEPYLGSHPVVDRAARMGFFPKKRRKWFRLSEADLADRESTDRTFLRLSRSGVVEWSEQRREQWHGLVARARRIASNTLAFVAGVVRKGLWRVVSERERDLARREIRAIEHPTPILHRSSLEDTRPRVANPGVKIIPRGSSPTERTAAELLGPIMEKLNMNIRPKEPSPVPSPFRDFQDRGHTESETWRLVDLGRRVYALIVFDRKTVEETMAACRSLGFDCDRTSVLEAGRRFSESCGNHDQWRLALSRFEDRETRGNTPFARAMESRRSARKSRTGEPLNETTVAKVYGEK